MTKRFYITTPIFYPNANLHMGHAYTTTLADAIARYHCLLNGKENVYFLTGSDENTQKMVDAAKKAGKEPMQFLDEIVGNFASLFGTLGIEYNQFIRTTDQQKHWIGAQEIWKRIAANDDLEMREYEGLYCVGHEAFITEKDLVDGKCPDHGTEPVHLKEKNYFFKLSKYTEEIKKKIESDELRIIPETRKNEILSLLNEGLEDVSFSRPRKPEWPAGLGVPVPNDPSQVMYVWCDALSNYITALGFATADDTLYQKFWPVDAHVIGKDILRFHAAIWPGMLLSAGLPLPKALLVHGFITSGGKKMSKSLGNVIDPQELLTEYGADAVRYYLLRHISPFEDGDLTREGFKEAYNGNLANGLGNLVARVMKMAEDHLTEPVSVSKDLPSDFKEAFEAFNVMRAMEITWHWIQTLDQKIAEQKPFSVIKENPEEGKRIIAELVSDLHLIGEMLKPTLPDTSEKLLAAIKANKKPENLFARKD